MASARIRLEVDPATKRRTVVIGYESDEEALPHEHEEAHRLLVEKLLEKGIVKEGDPIRVERGEETKGERSAKKEEQPGRQSERQGVKQGS